MIPDRAGDESERESGTLRAFVAVPLPPAARERAAGLMARLAASGRLIRWTDPRLLHLTLAFLGDSVPEGLVPGITAATDEAVRRLPPFAVGFGGVGRFPAAGRPRVVWLGVTTGREELARLQDAVAAAVEPLGFPREARAWQPHVTLGRRPFRVRPDPAAEARLAATITGLRDEDAGGGIVDAASLFTSTRSAAGPAYVGLHVSRLGGG